MSDIVERLRRYAGSVCISSDTDLEAADEIEGRRQEVLEQARLLGMSGEREADLRGEIERLQKALSTMTAAYADAVEQHNQTLDELNAIEAAAKNLILVKGRHHAEKAYKRLEERLK